MTIEKAGEVIEKYKQKRMLRDSEYKKKRQLREARLEIVAEMYKRGHSYREIQQEVMRRLSLKTYALQTVHKDVHKLLSEWRSDRIENIDMAVQLELARIDDTIRELWSQWEKSKDDYQRKSTYQTGRPDKKNSKEISISQIQKQVQEVKGLGDVSYISEIRQQLVERRKLLGLYEPTKVDVTSGGQQITQIEIIHTAKESLDGNENTGNESVQPAAGGIQRQPI